MKKISVAYFDSPIGRLQLGANNRGVTFVTFMNGENEAEIHNPEFTTEPNTHVIQLIEELTEYFAGKRAVFTVSVDFEGTDFQLRVWNALLSIPFGKTTSYMHQTQTLGDPKAIRAVASANGKNKHAIIVPCHRVIGSNGSLTGYAGGIWRKKWLLNFEQKTVGNYTQQTLF